VLVEDLLHAVERGSRRIAVADPLHSLTYADLARLANVMRRQVESLTQARHVGIMLPSSCAVAGALYGVMWAGRVAVPLNFLLQPQELAGVVIDSEIDTILTIRHFAELAEQLPAHAVFLEDLPIKREMVLERIRRKPPPPRAHRDDTAILLYTSGTSGLPKGVCQTFGNLRHDMDASIERARLKTEQRFLGVLPLFHSFGLTTMLLVPITLRATTYYLPRFQPATVIQTIHREGLSVTMMIASMFSALLRAKSGGAKELASIEYAVSGGEALSDAVFNKFKERFGKEIIQGYGMTEASPVVSLNVPWCNRIGTVGQAIPGVEVAAFDDDARRLAAGETGELWIRGPIIMRGYFKKEADTREVLTDDGWYKTGDMGTVDAEGYISITGRKKEMIIVGGENVYPREIESVLDQHPAVAESAAIGHQDASRGEVVVAFVTLREGMETTDVALRDHCRGHLAAYKVPRRVIIAEDLPRGPTGKILKRKLRELF